MCILLCVVTESAVRNVEHNIWMKNLKTLFDDKNVINDEKYHCHMTKSLNSFNIRFYNVSSETVNELHGSLADIIETLNEWKYLDGVDNVSVIMFFNSKNDKSQTHVASDYIEYSAAVSQNGYADIGNIIVQISQKYRKDISMDDYFTGESYNGITEIYCSGMNCSKDFFKKFPDLHIIEGWVNGEHYDEEILN